MCFLKKCWEFLKAKKKYWLRPVVVTLIILLSLIIISSGSVIAPKIYNNF